MVYDVFAVRHFLPIFALWLPLLAQCSDRSGCIKPIKAKQGPSKAEKELAAQLDRLPEDPRQALLLVEKLRCQRLRRRLLAAGGSGAFVVSAPLPPLKEDEALLSFFQHRGRIWRWIYHGGKAVRLPDRELSTIEPLLIKARDELEFGKLEGDFSRLFSLLHRLHRELLGDVGSKLAGVKHLAAMPDGLLRALPLQLLVEGETPLRFAGDSRSFSYAPCLAFTRPLRRFRAAIALTPDYAEKKKPKPAAGGISEAKVIGQHFWSKHYDGAQATKQRLLAALGERGTLVHFAGHGLATLGEKGANAELVFPDGSALGIAALSKRRIAAPLVVLGSCTTAYAARFRDGKRLMAPTNVAEALLAAGAGSVVAASWGVKDRESARQMAVFYERLKEEGPALALASAQRSRRQRIQPPHPRFWGMYAVYGAWR